MRHPIPTFAHLPCVLLSLILIVALASPGLAQPATADALTPPSLTDTATIPALEAAPPPAPMPAPRATTLTPQQFVYEHFYYNYPALHLLPQYYDEIFSVHGRLPSKRWLEFYNEQLTMHEGAFFHLYEMVHAPGFTMNDLVSTGSLFGMAPRNAPMVDFGAERVQVYGRLGLMYGDIFLARGDHERAFACYDLVVRMTRLRPESPLLLHLISLQLRQLAYNHMAMAMDPFAGAPAGTLSPGVRKVLEQFRDNLTSYRPIEEQHDFADLLRGEVRDLWETLDFYDSPAQPLPAGSIRDQWLAALERWRPVWESGRVPDEFQVVSGRRRVSTLQTLRAEIDRLVDNTLFVREFSAATRRDSLAIRITLAQAFWKLLYLETLAILEPRTAGSFNEVKKVIPPELFPYMMLDPFTGLVFGTLSQQPGSRAHYYSFGPDRDDDAAKVLYNPERGLISDGDIPLFY